MDSCIQTLLTDYQLNVADHLCRLQAHSHNRHWTTLNKKAVLWWLRTNQMKIQFFQTYYTVSWLRPTFISGIENADQLSCQICRFAVLHSASLFLPDDIDSCLSHYSVHLGFIYCFPFCFHLLWSQSMSVITKSLIKSVIQTSLIFVYCYPSILMKSAV